jgi:hypothetical protein
VKFILGNWATEINDALIYGFHMTRKRDKVSVTNSCITQVFPNWGTLTPAISLRVRQIKI